MTPKRPPSASVPAALPGPIGRVKARTLRHFPTIAMALRVSGEADLVDRSAALTLFCMFAAVPGLFVAFSAVGFILGTVDSAARISGERLGLRRESLNRLGTWMHSALPGVTWNPADFAETMVRHRATHGIVGTIMALFLALGVFSRVDASVRALFGLPPRPTLRSAGYMSLIVLVVALSTMVLSIAAPVIEWSAHVAAHSIGAVSLGWLDGVAVLVTATQVLPVALVFYAQVRWSVGRVQPRRLATVALGYGSFWFLGQRLFSLYVSNVVKMDAVYGALTGVVALMMWLFYANIAFLFATALVAAWEHRARHESGHGTSTLARVNGRSTTSKDPEFTTQSPAPPSPTAPSMPLDEP